MWDRIYSVITDRYLTRRFLAISLLAMQFRIIWIVTSNVEAWATMNTATATVFTTAMGFFTLCLKFYFELKD